MQTVCILLSRSVIFEEQVIAASSVRFSTGGTRVNNQ